jgi:hypothetical protein
VTADRLDRVLGELGEFLERKRSLPVIQPGDAEAVCGLFHAQVDRGTAAREQAAQAAGHRIACHDGCSQCCHNMPAVFAGEAVTIAEWLERPEQAAVRARFVEKYPAWLARVADLVERWAAAAASGDVDAGRHAAREAWQRQVMCAFNHEGSCSIYEVRPNVCRHAHALDTPARCAPDTTEDVATLPFPPLDQYIERILPVVYAMHAAIRRDHVGSQPLCVAVFERLTP